MASEDVIELGSSDEEPPPKPPTPKKAKPVPNAMVHIPNKLPGLTIKATKITGNKKTTVKIPVGAFRKNPLAHATKTNNAVKSPQVPFRQPTPVRSGSVVNPMHMMKNVNSSQVKINNLISMATQVSPNLSINRVVKNVKRIAPMQTVKSMTTSAPIKRLTPINISRLPPDIVIRKRNNIPEPLMVPKRKLPMNAVVPKQLKKIKLHPMSQVGDMLTVELDEDASQSSTSPQWYLRPEDQREKKLMEEQNNKEPEQSKMIEITIEDSPIKPPPNKRTAEVASETAITIDDSPVKPIPEKSKVTSGSGSEDEGQTRSKSPTSRKKLEYPKHAKPSTVIEKSNEAMDVDNPNTIEIEIAPMELNKDSNAFSSIATDPLDTTTKVFADGDKDNAVVCGGSSSDDIIIEIPESPAKRRKVPTPKKTCPEKTKTVVIEDTEETNLDSEFHPVYQSFINMCFQLENSDDMKKIVEKKIKTYYRQVPKEYTESEEFVEMVSSKILAMKSGPEKMFLYIKDIVDELNLQRKIAKSEILNAALKKQKETEKEAAEFYGDVIEKDAKKKRQVRKLEKTLKKLHRAINKLEEQEVDFDDDGDSVYILTERYKERIVRVHAKLCQLSNTKMPSEPRVHIDPRPGQPGGPARRLERWVNKRVPVGTPLPFPDFHDVLRCVRDANDEEKLGWNEADIMEEARDLFTRCGRKLQRRRQENEWRIAASRITGDAADPADDDELRRKLDDNRKLAGQKEAELINKYADRQKTLQLEAVEIGDKEAEESPVESGDEAQEDAKEATLENTSERKERLMRLIKEKARNSKGNQSDNNSQTEKTDNNSEVEEIMPDKPSKKEQVPTAKSHEPLKADETEMEVDSGKDGSKTTEKPDNEESVQVSSDDSKKIGSDVDELHLLQKLHSETEHASSTVESSDTDSPIAISDTLESGDDAGKKDGKDSEVVSIENSSESESEANKNNDANNESDERNADSENIEEVEDSQEVIIDPDVAAVAMNSDIDEPKKPKRNSNEEYTGAVEDILLASSDEDSNQGKDAENQPKESNELSNPTDNYVNLKDDSISIGDTQVEGVDSKDKAPKSSDIEAPCNNILLASSDEDSNQGKDAENQPKESNELSNPTDNYVNLKDDSISIGDTQVEGVDSKDKAPKSSDIEAPCNNILLASSDEDSNQGKDAENQPKESNELSNPTDNYVNLKDDSISIGDTQVEGVDSKDKAPKSSNIEAPCNNILLASSYEDSNQGKDAENQPNESNELSNPTDNYVNLKDDSISIGNTQVEGVDAKVTAPKSSDVEAPCNNSSSTQDVDNLDNGQDNNMDVDSNQDEQNDVALKTKCNKGADKMDNEQEIDKLDDTAEDIAHTKDKCKISENGIINTNPSTENDDILDDINELLGDDKTSNQKELNSCSEKPLIENVESG